MLNRKTILHGLAVGLAVTVLNVPTLWHTSLQPAAEDLDIDVGAPTRRVGGGSRGAGITLPMLATLAPNYVGKTLQASPSLYWALSEVVDKPLKFTLVYSDPLKYGIDPVLETTVDKPTKEGVQSLDLAKQGVELKPNVEYQWSMSIVMDPKQSSQDIVASGLIMRTTKDSLPKSATLDENNLATYEDAQLFYDAIQILSEKMAKNPNDETLKPQWTALLEKVGLKEVTKF